MMTNTPRGSFFLQHPIHLHLVPFQVIGRYDIIYDISANTDGFCMVAPAAPTTGACLELKDTIQEPSGMPAVGLRAIFPANNLAYDVNIPIPALGVYNATNQGPKVRL
jgi:FtsP/CotA-like multicopper oxidase with cupredoxin domain